MDNLKNYKVGYKKKDKWVYQNLVVTPDILHEVIKTHLSDETITQISISKEN